jgi:hypothetical protein
VKDKIKLLHSTSHPEWHSNIRKIFSLIPNVSEIKFCNSKNRICNKEYPFLMHFTKRCPGDPEEFEMNFFPNFQFNSNYHFNFPYIVIQPKSGREEQKKEIPIKIIEKIINNSKYKVILIGTSKKFESIKNCINLINKTTLFDAFSIIQNSKYFIGFFGLMTMVALSNKINCNFIYQREVELENRVYGTPWENYCKNIIAKEDYRVQIYISFKIKAKIIPILHKLLGEKIMVHIRRVRKRLSH